MDMDLDEVALSWSCNSSAMLTRREASTQVYLSSLQVQVQLSFASLDLDLTSLDLVGVFGGSPCATPLESNSVKLKSNSFL